MEAARRSSDESSDKTSDQPVDQRGVSRRASAVATSATLAITTKANELRAAGHNVIGFGAGEPDFPTPPEIVAAAAEATGDPRNHRYSPAAGLLDLREAIAAMTQRDSGYGAAPSQVVVTNGAKHAVYMACQVLLDDGDEVLLPAPYWVSYPEAIRLAGGVPVPIPTDETTGFRVSVSQLEAAATDRTKLLLFASPSNPTGAVYPPDEVAAIGEWAADRGVWVLTDEIYQHLTYDDNEFASMPVAAPGVAPRCVVVNGVSKTFAMTGWRVGWMIGPPAVAAAATRLQSHMTSNVSNVAQRAAFAAVTGPLDAAAAMRVAFDRRRRIMFEMLNAIDGVDCMEPQGAFYAFPSVRGLLGKTLAGDKVETSLDLASVLLGEVQVAVVPGEAFDAPGYLRLSFALGDDDLVEGLTRFQDMVSAAS